MGDYEIFKKAAIRGQDEIIVCPYNPSHHLNKSRMQYHLVKCAKQHGHHEYDTCPFNATHRVPKPEFQFHVDQCPDRRSLETHKYQSQDELPKNNANFPEYAPVALPPSEENWDNEDLQSSYEPEKHLNNTCVFRNIQGATKSERKLFRMEERARISTVPAESTESTVPVDDEVPLRPPRSLPKGMTVVQLGSRLGMGRGLPCSSSSGSSPDDEGKSDCRNVAKGRGAIPRT